jgi:hypothetical protein
VDDGKNKIHTNVNFTLPRLVPTNNYAFAASVLLKTISTNANTIKRWAILESGTTSHFLMTNAPATNIFPTTKPIIARLPNCERVHSTHMCTINISLLPPRARATHIIPGLAPHSLLTVVSLCNAGCTVHFTKIGRTIIYRGHTIVCCHKRARTGLWMIPLSKDTSPPPADFQPTIAMVANVVATSSATKYAGYDHQHQLLCSLPAATLLLALDKSTKLQTIPGLTTLLLICSHLPKSKATNKGHICGPSAPILHQHATSTLTLSWLMPRWIVCFPPMKPVQSKICLFCHSC